MRISDWSSDVCSSDLQVGAQKPAAAAAVEEEDLRRIAVRRELVRVAGLEFGDDAVGQKRAVAREGGEELDAAGKAGIVGEIDARFVESGGDGFEVEFGAGGGRYRAGHRSPLRPSSSAEGLGVVRAMLRERRSTRLNP